MATTPVGVAETDAVLSAQSSGQDVGAHSNGSDSVLDRSGNKTWNKLQEIQLPGLTEVSQTIRGRRRLWDGSRSLQEKRTDSEFDIVIVPPDGCYMSGTDSDDSDWSIGWFEPHPVDFTDDDSQESFGVLVRSYWLPAPELSTQSKDQSEGRDSETPAWDTLLASMKAPNKSSPPQFGMNGSEDNRQA